ncbi:MAG: hypothetical protein RIE32_01680 [Phycisphaerales bacterium]
MGDESVEHARPLRGLDYRLLIAGGLVVAVVLLFALSRPFGVGRGDAAGGSIPASDMGGSMPSPADRESATLAAAHAEARALAAESIAEAEGKIKGLESLVAEFEGAVDEWAMLRAELLENEDGRKIAADESLTQDFLALHDALRPSDVRISVEQLRNRVDALAQPLDEMRSAASSVHAPDSLIEAVDELMMLADTGRTRLTDQLRAMRSITQRASGLSPSAGTLQSAMDEVGGRRAQEHADRIAEIRHRGEQERFANLQKAEEALQRRAAIASDPMAAKILGFLTYRNDTFESVCGRAFDDYTFFRESLVEPRIAERTGYTKRTDAFHIDEAYKVFDNQAQAAFGISLHNLFCTFMLSAENQEKYTTSIERMQAIAQGDVRATPAVAQDAARWLQEGKPLPEPILP